MKKLMVILSVLLLATVVLAQDEEKGVTGKGFKVGLNLSNVSGSDADLLTDAISELSGLNVSKKTLMGFAFGGFLTYQFSPTVALQPEVLYSLKGFTLSALGTDVDLQISYIEVPVLMKFIFGTGSAKPCLLVGPELGILVSSKIKAGGVSVDAKDMWKTTDLGIVFGGGVDFAVGQGVMTLDGRYTMGLTNIPDSGPISIDMKNTNISFMVGYGF